MPAFFLGKGRFLGHTLGTGYNLNTRVECVTSVTFNVGDVGGILAVLPLIREDPIVR